jgi:hypothetical protein
MFEPVQRGEEVYRFRTVSDHQGLLKDSSKGGSVAIGDVGSVKGLRPSRKTCSLPGLAL